MPGDPPVPEKDLQRSSLDARIAEPVTAGGRLRASYVWVGGGVLVSQGITWLVTLLVARLLEPRDYGLVGMAVVFVAMCRTLQDAGLASALIQRKDLDERTIRSAFTLLMLTGAAATAAGWLLAPLVGVFYREPQVVPVMRVLSLGFLLTAVRTVHLSLFSRQLEFSKRTRAEVGSAVGGALATLTLAWYGFGVWSLVFGNLFAEALQTIFVYSLSAWRPHWLWDGRAIKGLLNFGLPQTASNLLWNAYGQADFFIIGLLSGSTALGFYTMGWTLATVFNDRLVTILNKVSFPAFSALQRNLKDVADHWLKLSELVAWITFPALTGIALVVDHFITVALTPRWLPSVPLARLLCFMSIMSAQTVLMPPVVNALGYPKKNLRQAIINAALLIPAFLIGGFWGGAFGVALASALVAPVILGLRLQLTLSLLKMPVGPYLRCILPPLASTLAMAAFVLLVRQLPIQNPLVGLALQCGVGAVVYAACGSVWLWKQGRLGAILATAKNTLRGR